MKFKTRTEQLPSIDYNKMYFVNRDNAIYQLQQIHQSNSDRNLDGAGPVWKVPICDSISGLGKTELAQQYTKRCMPVASSKQYNLVRSDFSEMLSKAITVSVVFMKAELWNAKTFEEMLLQKLQDACIPLFDVAPVCLYQYHIRILLSFCLN